MLKPSVLLYNNDLDLLLYKEVQSVTLEMVFGSEFLDFKVLRLLC